MGNHVIRDRIWHSRKLRRCSKPAALAWPWIFLVADEWGRFEYDPRGIWSRVFSAREDVSLDEVTAWMSEYEHFGLLERYHLDGGLAVWTGFEGRPPSRRRASNLPDPQQFKTVRKKVAHRQATVRRSEGPPTRPRAELELEQETRARAGDKSESKSLPPTAPAAPEIALVPVLTWSKEAVNDWREFMGGRPFDDWLFPPLKRLLGEHVWAEIRPRWRAYLAQLNPSFIGPGCVSKFETTYARWGRPRAPTPKERASVERFVAGIEGGMVDDKRRLDQGDGSIVDGWVEGPGESPGRDGKPGQNLPSDARQPDRR